MMAMRGLAVSDVIDAQSGSDSVRAARLGVGLEVAAWDRAIQHRFHTRVKRGLESRQYCASCV